MAMTGPHTQVVPPVAPTLQSTDFAGAGKAAASVIAGCGGGEDPRRPWRPKSAHEAEAGGAEEDDACGAACPVCGLGLHTLRAFQQHVRGHPGVVVLPAILITFHPAQPQEEEEEDEDDGEEEEEEDDGPRHVIIVLLPGA